MVLFGAVPEDSTTTTWSA